MNPSLAAAAQAVRPSNLFSGCKQWVSMAEEFQHSRDGKHNNFSMFDHCNAAPQHWMHIHELRQHPRCLLLGSADHLKGHVREVHVVAFWGLIRRGPKPPATLVAGESS